MKIPAALAHLLGPEELDAAAAKAEQLQNTIIGYGVNDNFIISEDLDQELRRQSMSYLTVTDAQADAKTLVDGIDAITDTVRAIMEMHTRKAYEDGVEALLPYEIGGIQPTKLSKATEGVIKSAIDSYDFIVELKNFRIEAAHLLNKLNGLSQAWLQRSIMLRTIVERETNFVMNPDAIAAAGRAALARERRSA